MFWLMAAMRPGWIPLAANVSPNVLHVVVATPAAAVAYCVAVDPTVLLSPSSIRLYALWKNILSAGYVFSVTVSHVSNSCVGKSQAAMKIRTAFAMTCSWVYARLPSVIIS
jgi:hypothetical protein